MSFAKLFWLWCLLLPAIAGAAESGRYQVYHVADGDTLSVTGPEGSFTVRISRIDAPERKQPFGQESLNYLRRLTLNKTVTLEIKGKDKYDRVLAEVWVDGKNYSTLAVAQGLAYPYYDNDQELAALAEQAKRRRVGVWSLPENQRQLPGDYRREQRDLPPSTPAKTSSSIFSVGCEKKTCSQMRDCAEARYQLTVCGNTRIDGNKDGIPCESLCKP
jgi:endonuclease YncB( thermonuclease family)